MGRKDLDPDSGPLGLVSRRLLNSCYMYNYTQDRGYKTTVLLLMC